VLSMPLKRGVLRDQKIRNSSRYSKGPQNSLFFASFRATASFRSRSLASPQAQNRLFFRRFCSCVDALYVISFSDLPQDNALRW
jgi:hypothetical protein